MVKLKGPLMSIGAHGSIDKVLTYSGRKSGHQTRKYSKPAGIPSAKQRAQRRLTEFLVAQWQNMTENQKNTWEAAAKASDKRLAGYHYFLRETQRDLYTHHGLCSYWHCNEKVNGTCLDISGNDLHLTLGLTDPFKAPLIGTSKNSKYGNCLNFTIDDQEAGRTSPDLWKVGTGDFSYCFSMYWEPTSRTETLLRWSTFVGHVIGMKITITAANKIQITIGDAVAADTSTAFEAPQNQWVDIVVTRESGDMIVYANGIIVLAAETLPRSINSADTVSIGCELWSGELRFHGKLDEILFYNRALSAAEITTRQNFNNNV